MQITEVLLTPQVLMLAAAIIAIVWSVGMIKIGETQIKKHWLWRNIVPIVPLVLGVAGAFMPEVICDGCAWGTKVVAGLWAGFIAAHGYKVFKRIVVDKLREQAGGE